MARTKITSLRDFPQVEQLLQDKKLASALPELPRPIVSELVKAVVARKKKEFKDKGQITMASVRAAIVEAAEAFKQTELTRVINATGIVAHTNLGRAPLSEELFDSVKEAVVGYSNLEFDLSTGKRGQRGLAAERYLAALSGAEAGTIVNNCAAALFLTLNSLANRRKVIISRGELVQIGGGFRIHDILKRSGAKIVEVGATNITTIKDYEQSIDDKTALILKVHKSNFTQHGFIEEVSLKELSVLAKKYDIPLVNDLGSGLFIPTRPILGFSEPTVQQSGRGGADLTTFSGDKMLGGSQAGLIVGRKDYIDRIKKNPIYRTMRVDKIVFSLLEKLFTSYLDSTPTEQIKLWQILSTKESELYKSGKSILSKLGNPTGITVAATRAFVGGGSMPQADIPSVGLIFDETYKATKLLSDFRSRSLPVIGRIENEQFILDLKAIDPSDYAYLIDTIREIIS